MFSQKVIVGLITLFVLYMVSAQDMSMSKCKGADVKWSDAQMATMMDCLNMTGADTTNDLTKNTTGPFWKCMFVKASLVTDKGMLKKENIPTTFPAGLPEAIKMPLTTQISKCFELSGGKVDMADPTCAAFNPLSDCVQKAYTSLCMN